MPMFIKAVHLENFKSFKTAQSVTFGNKNLVVGKNGSGKSNFMAALASPFLGEKMPQYGGSEGRSSVRLEIDNGEGRFPLGKSFTLSVVWNGSSVEYSVDGRAMSWNELRGLMDNAGLNKECIVRQGTISHLAEMPPRELYQLVGRIAGAEHYEECKAKALGSLDETSEQRVREEIEKIERRLRRGEEWLSKLKERRDLCRKKNEVEYELACWDIDELNKSIAELSGFAPTSAMDLADEAAGLELEENRQRLSKLREEKRAIEESLERHKEALDGLLSEVILEGTGSTSDNKENKGNQGLSVIDQLFKFGNQITAYFDQRVLAKQTAKDQLLQDYEKIKKNEAETYTLYQACRFYDAMKDRQTSPEAIEAELSRKQQELDGLKHSNGLISQMDTEMSLAAEQKGLWVKERQLKEELRVLRETEKSLNGKLLFLGRESINIYDGIKESKGVLGTVFDLLSVPDELLDAYEAVTRNALFWIVVEDEDVAIGLIKGIKGRANFVAMNAVNRNAKQDSAKGNAINDDRLIRLADAVRCDVKYRGLAELVCKDFYVAADLETAVCLSHELGVNVVTVDGDIASKSGAITGGYEPANNVLREIKHNAVKIRRTERALVAVARGLEELENRRALLGERQGTDDQRMRECLEAVVLCLGWKLEQLSGRELNLPTAEAVEKEHLRLAQRLPVAQRAFAEGEEALAKSVGRRQRVDELVGAASRAKAMDSEIQQLEADENRLIKTAWTQPGECVPVANVQCQHRHLLMDKRRALADKMGIADPLAVKPRGSRPQLVEQLKQLTAAVRAHGGAADGLSADFDAAAAVEIKGRLEGLCESRGQILGLVGHLDQRKEEALALTFSLIADNYAYYFKAITGGLSSLRLGSGVIHVVVDDREVDVGTLSGGQRTVIAVCLILAIQKNDPSPFYILDEMDANLDPQHCARVYAILAREASQYFICSFKEESVSCADKFYGVAVSEKESFIGEIDAALAMETIRY